ncbi:putative cytoplasmic protein [Paratrimastix pyriformis]|uniref:Cytoplasmic protein n=1 Tax=Paratrimastix pyriformis TaxID=342808 RepID=A0ABQ8UXS9_9EUKA|nr:putative cytoplasmic protein [Paratrimastix pyriformis]
MIVYKDIFSGDEMLSDSFPATETDAFLEVESANITVGDEQINIGANPAEGEVEEGPEAQRVNNIVHGFKLHETSFAKPDYLKALKDYMMRVKAYLQEKTPDRVAPFMAAAKVAAANIVANFADYTFYTGESYEQTAMIVLSKFVGEATTPTFFFWKDGLRQDKY